MTDLTNAAWRKSTRSTDTGNCVEVADNLPGVIAVRDSKNPNEAALTFTPHQWHAFIEGARQGEFDL